MRPVPWAGNLPHRVHRHPRCADPQQTLAFAQNDLGIGNRLQLLDDELLANLGDIQIRNGLRPSTLLASGDFTVEMETGTGKTYVYLRTIFELNRRYGFTKFVIVVPSVAIKEGVYKTLQITEEHFRSLYANTPFEYFLYDSSKLGQVRNFATSPNIQIMVVTVGAINKKDVNNLYKDTREDRRREAHRPHQGHAADPDRGRAAERGRRPGRPGKEALGAMNPLCTLRYSATHADKHHMLYRLDAVDAYERKLVKQIEVASLEVEGGHNKGYVKLLSTSNKKGTVQRQGRAGRAARHEREPRDRSPCSPATICEQITGRAVYADCLVQNIGCKAGEEFLELSNLENPLRPGEAIGDVDSDALKRLMIRRTIEEHLDKELRLRPQGIKVLSLFFIDVGRALPQLHRRRRSGEGQVCPDVRGGIPQGRRQAEVQHALQGSGSGIRRRRKSTTAISPSTRRERGRTPPRTTRATATTPSAPTTSS